MTLHNIIILTIMLLFRCNDNFVISLELSCIYRNFNSRLRGKYSYTILMTGSVQSQLQTNFPALLGPKELPV